MRTSALLVLGALGALTMTACDRQTPATTEPETVTTPNPGSAQLDRGSSDDEERDDDRDNGDNTTRRYKVTITNLTSGQPMSPGVLLTHNRRVSLFELRDAASEGIRSIAENGDESVAVSSFLGAPGVQQVISTGAPIGRQGATGGPANTLSVEIDAAANRRYLSLAVMLICTNDGFTGLDGVRLPRGNQPAVFYTDAYDAGTEVNDEKASSIVPPCFAIGPVLGLTGGGNRTPENGVIRHHRGIQGIADLTSAHAWRDPVARVEIQRIR